MGLGVHARVADDQLLVDLNKIAARAAARRQAVAKAVRLHTKLLSYRHSVDELKHAGETAAQESAVEETLSRLGADFKDTRRDLPVR